VRVAKAKEVAGKDVAEAEAAEVVLIKKGKDLSKQCGRDSVVTVLSHQRDWG